MQGVLLIEVVDRVGWAPVTLAAAHTSYAPRISETSARCDALAV